MIRLLLFLFLLYYSAAPNTFAANNAPVWAAEKVDGDPLFFIQKEGEKPAALLMRAPSEAPVIRSATLEVTYEAGKDYEWAPGAREVRLPAGSRIPFTAAAALRPPPKSPHSYSAYRDGKSWMLFGEGRYFHDLQCVAAYPSKDEWKGPRPAAAPEGQLVRIRAKLKAGSPVKLLTLGDSISTGANASGSAGAPPMQPGYHGLVARGLEARFGSKVTEKNLSVGGMDSAWGLKQVPAVLAEAPDVVLLAFGMNDASGRRKTEDFVKIIKQTIDQIQAARPECDVIVISPMTANPEWSHAAPELYPAYAKALGALSGPGCALADVTSVWTAVLEKKPYLCLSGNGLNHPNDFGHRLYADVVLAAIGEKKDK
jgi:lysophospholipase L1-like esterase